MDGSFPGIIMFNVRSDSWRERLPTIRSVALEFGFEPLQDQDRDYGAGQTHWLVYRIPGIGWTSATVDALLSGGCGLGDDSEVIYSAKHWRRVGPCFYANSAHGSPTLTFILGLFLGVSVMHAGPKVP